MNSALIVWEVIFSKLLDISLTHFANWHFSVRNLLSFYFKSPSGRCEFIAFVIFAPDKVTNGSIWVKVTISANVKFSNTRVAGTSRYETELSLFKLIWFDFVRQNLHFEDFHCFAGMTWHRPAVAPHRSVLSALKKS